MVTHQYELNESFKALLDGIFSDKEVATKLKIAFEEVVNDRATTQRVNLEKLKDEALEQIRNELLTKDVFYTEMKATKDVFQSEMKAIEAKLEAEIAKIRAEIAEVRQELKQEIAEVRQEIAEVKQELKQEIAELGKRFDILEQKFKFYAIGLGTLIILFQPKVFDFITSFLK